MQNRLDDSKSLEGKIKAEAFRLGFSLCGFTTAESPEGFQHYEKWLLHKQHAGMAYLESAFHRGMRQYPDQLFPGVKTIVSLGWPYFLNKANFNPEANNGLIAGYTAKMDYHLLLPARVNELISFLHREINPDIKAQVYTDSAPIMEREIASRAGLGWIGKNSCLISPEIGSAFLLAELFLDFSLQPDQPFTQDRCGTCRRCIEACPTGCIQPDRTIDSNRCISYLTIENKGSISEELRLSIGKWLFGCDVCQAVCPWNKSNNDQSSPLSELNWPVEKVHQVLSITADEFLDHYKDSSIYRSKLKGLQRNALIWLGNNGDSTDRFKIENFIHTIEDQVLFEAANWAIKKLK